ncbi:hypothetical protein JKP88DRAFT_316761 [Tribonema minus]|uniref:USP domain-containing protein n=1 Tax=Tribonema minus TaxID=303371 RepID=A0A836CEK4_9STRA|nr:hypothetical protein JKP88DRAFT_316761 [Tribonema minus]
MMADNERELTTQVRQAMSELAVELATELGSMDPGIFQWLTEPLVHLSPTDSQCTQYFMALDQVLELMLRAFLAGDAPAEGEMADAAGASAERRAVEGQLQALGQALSVKLMVLRRESAHATEGAGSSRGGIDGGASSTLVLQCCLVLLTRLLKGAPEGMMPLAGTELGENLIGHVFGSMLFALPQSATVTVTAATTAHPLCEGNGPRAAAFQVLLAAAGRDTATALPQLLYMCGNMMSGATPGLRSCWHVETSADGNRGGSGYVGLKNQGCTCYMNSLLQQLFMVPAFREAICSAAPMPRPSDASLPEDPAQWVGRRLMMQFESQQPMQAKVMGYQPDTGMHTIRYTTIRPPATAPGTAPGTVPEASAENSDDEGQGIVHTFVLRSGRPGKETGIFTPLPKVHKGSSAVVPQRNLTDKEKEKEAEDEHTRLLLEQVQRTFCYLNDSQTRYFDPRPLVEVCKCLNLQYSVYHQNDASEFCTKLLDRLETAVKGDSAKALANCFGGRLVQEKIPRGCSHRTSREDPFIALELIIRGKESIQESLAALVEGELMEGDNKVECDKCGTKKDSMRRTSLGALPNLLILHLKRFDLDYTTFETVKLNNRCEFPLTLDVKPYTQEGIEEKEALQLALDKAVSSAGGDLTLDELQTLKHTHSQQVMTGPADGGPVAGATGPASVPSTPKGAAVGATPDAATQAADAEYLYELKGILVHAGVAQGGHYYSFIKERQPRTGREPKWFKFDDDDVLPFDPANIETCCFGGMGPVQGATSWRGSGNSSSTAVTVPMEQERVANALMLFYEKVTPKPLPVEPAPATAKTVEGAPLAPPAVAAVTATEPATAAAVGTASSMDTATGGTAGPAGLRLSRICEAFTREVWLSNLQQTVQSYVLDRGFHSFVYELVNMALAAGDANADATSTCQAPQQGSSGSKRKALSPEHSAEPAPQAESVRQQFTCKYCKSRKNPHSRSLSARPCSEAAQFCFFKKLLTIARHHRATPLYAPIHVMLQRRTRCEHLPTPTSTTPNRNAPCTQDMMTDEDVTLPTPDAQPTEASGTSLHSRATALGVTALLDVMLHANDRCKAAGRKLQLLLSTAMAADPLACRHFVLPTTASQSRNSDSRRQFAANMLKPSASRAQHEAAAPNTPASASGYLRQFIFECVDDNARALSCKLFASAICALAASVEAEESDAAAASAAAATVSGGGGGGGGALLRELLRQLLQQLGEIPEYHRHGEQVFMLLRDVAAGSDLVRRWLVGEDAIAQVSMFITRKLTAPKLQEAYPLIYQNQIQSSTQRHRMRPNDFIYAPEAIAVMMGLRVPDREELVCKDTSASERADPSEAYRATYGENVYADPRMKLTEKCERVLCDIFKAFAVEDEIDAKGVWEYLHAVHMNNSDQSTVKSVLNQFAQSEQTQNLTLAGFLEWYRVKISGLALVDSVSELLVNSTQGFEAFHIAASRDLKTVNWSPPMEGSRGAAAAATTDSAGGSATSAQQQSSTPPAAAVAAAAAADAEPIPPLSQHALCEYALYGEAFSGGAFWPLPIGCAIARRVCSAYQAQFTSQRLLDSCLFQLARQPAIPPAATAYYGSYDADDVALTNLVKLLTAILDIEDQYQVQRLQYACWESQLGLVKAGGHLAAIQQMEAGQQLASLRGARYLQQQQQLTALWAVVDQYGRAVMQLANACAAFSRFLHQRVRGEDLAWVREVDTKRSINFNSVYNRQQQYTNRDQQYSDNDSNENDNDSDYYSSGSTPNIIGYTVHGAGVREVNGDYHRCSEKSDNCPMYEMPTEFHGQQVSFQLFRCRLDQQHQRWYLSIVPQGQRPGTNQDIDFYEASVTRDMANSMYPPTGKDAWVATAEMSKPYAHLYTREQREPPPELLPCAEVDDGNSSEDLHQREVQRHVGRRTGGQGPRGSAPPSRPSGNQQSAADSRVSAPTSSVLPGPVVTAGSGIAGLPGSPNAPGSDELYASFDTRMMPRGGAAVGSPQAADAELEINEYDDGSSLRAEGDSDFSGELDDDSDGAIHSPPSPQQQQRQEQVLPPQRPTRTRGRGPVDSFPASDTF